MEGYFQLKSKRKDLEDVNNDFSEFSLSSPARKIRRLDSELPPIIEEEDCNIPTAFENSSFQEQRFECNSSGGIKIEELPNEPNNDERAIALFKPINNTPLVHSPSNFSVAIAPEIISGLKNQLMWFRQTNSWRLTDDRAAEINYSALGDGCLALVPWVPSKNCSTSVPVVEFPSQNNSSEMMEDEYLEEANMDIAKMDVEDGNSMKQSDGNEHDVMSLSEGFNQWQQQHCLTPQPPQNSTGPIIWYR